MKKIYLILFVVTLIFLSGCKTNQPQAQNSQQNQQTNCPIIAQPLPIKGCTFNPIYNEAGTCLISYNKVCSENIQNQQSNTPTPKEFTVEADDLGLYPDTINVNKGDKVKITFKVRQDNVYHAGLDFRSDVFSTVKVLPGGVETVEFTADKTSDFRSYWPSTSKLKATGTINVM